MPTDPTLINCLIGAIATLAACIGALFAWFKSQFTMIVSKLDDCESDRLELWGKIAEMAAGNSIPKPKQ